MKIRSKRGVIVLVFTLLALGSIATVCVFSIQNHTSTTESTTGTSPEEQTESQTGTDMLAASFSELTPFGSSEKAPSVTMNVHISNPIRIIPKTVYGEGLLNFNASDAFVHTTTFINTVKDSKTGALRWPSAGHSNVPIFHFDNNHTSSFDGGKSGYLDPTKIGYTTKNTLPGNIWDPLYNTADSAPATEQVTLAGFVNTIKQTNTVPFMIFTWRSGELWRNINGQRVMYRDPAPRTIDGTPMLSAEAAKLTSRQEQLLENQLMLKEYFEDGGPSTLIAQIGEELWSGWEDGQIPWDDPISNPSYLKRGQWLAQTLKWYFTDLATFAKAHGYPVKFAVQFKESTEGGNKVMTIQERDFLRSEFDSLITNLGPNLSFMTASVHYRGSWEQWLQEPQMQLAFMTDSGMGSLADIRDWFKQYVASKGYPNIDLIPHANSFGETLTKNEAPVAPWQISLMSSQYLIEAIKAGYSYTFGFPGFLGDYDGFANLDKTPDAIAGMQNGVYTKAPMLYALASIGEPLQHDTQLLDVKNPDPAIVTMGLQNAQQLHLYFINKHNSTTSVSIDTTFNLQKSKIAVQRFSRTELHAKIPANKLIHSFANNYTKLSVTLAPYSMSVVDINL